VPRLSHTSIQPPNAATICLTAASGENSFADNMPLRSRPLRHLAGIFTDAG